jgi:hypothetical protein
MPYLAETKFWTKPIQWVKIGCVLLKNNQVYKRLTPTEQYLNAAGLPRTISELHFPN